MLRVLLLVLLAVLQLQAQLVKYEGRYSAIRIDNFVTPQMKPYLALEDQQRIMLSKESINALSDDEQSLFRIGNQLTIEGEWKNALLEVKSVSEKAGRHQARQYAPYVTPRVNLVRRVIIIPLALYFQNTGVMMDVASAEDLRRDLIEGEFSYKKMIEQESWGKYTMNAVVTPKVVVYTNETGCEEEKWRDAAYAILRRDHNIDIQWYNYDSISMIIPDVQACGYGGVAFDTNCGHEITSYWCQTYVKTNGYTSIFAHELGHNIAWAHANTASETTTWEYGDNSDPMGVPWGLTYHNAVHKIQVGWIPDERIAKASRNVSGQFFVTPTGALTEPLGTTQAVKIPVRWNDFDTNLYVSYRVPYGKWNSDSNLYNRVHIQIWPNPVRNQWGGWVDGPGRLSMLTDGGDFTFAGVKITARSFSAQGATILVTDPNAPTVRPTPAPTVKPTSAPTVKPTSAPTTSARVLYQIKNVNSGKCMDLTSASSANGVDIVQKTCSSSSNTQVWELKKADGDYYYLVNYQTGGYTDVAACGGDDGVDVRQWTGLNNYCQQFTFNQVSTGVYRFVNRNSQKVIDVSGCSLAENGNIQQWTWLNNACQKFTVTRVTRN